MRRLTYALVTGCLLFAFALYAKDKPVNFSGVWKLNKDKSVLPAGSSYGSTGMNSYGSRSMNNSSSTSNQNNSTNSSGSDNTMNQSSSSTENESGRSSTETANANDTGSSSAVSPSDVQVASMLTVRQTQDSLTIDRTLANDFAGTPAGSVVRDVVAFQSGAGEMHRPSTYGTGSRYGEKSSATSGTDTGSSKRNMTDGMESSEQPSKIIHCWATWSSDERALNIFYPASFASNLPSGTYRQKTDGADHDGADHDGTDGTGLEKGNSSASINGGKEIWSLASQGRVLQIELSPNAGSGSSGSTSSSAGTAAAGQYHLVYDKVKSF